MKIAVIAANGRTGRVFVETALASGHMVHAGVFGESTLVPSDRLKIMRCDATSATDVDELIKTCDAIVSLIGHTRRSKASVQTEAIKVVAQCMTRNNIERLISLTGTGVRFPGDTPSIIDKVLNQVVSIIDPSRVKDGISHVEYLKSTTLNWTVVRVLKLTNGNSTDGVKLSFTGPAELLTPRKRVALAIMQVITDPAYYKKAPIVQGGKK